MKIRTVVAALVASAAIPAFASTTDLSVAAQLVNKQLASDASIGMTGATYGAVDAAATMTRASADLANSGYPPPVPEPATWAMLAGGLTLVGVMTRRRRS